MLIVEKKSGLQIEVRICEALRESLSSTVLGERLIGCGNNLFVNSKFIPTDA